MTSFTVASRKLPNGSQQIGRVANGSALIGYVVTGPQRTTCQAKTGLVTDPPRRAGYTG